MAETCPRCGATLPEGFRYCGACGSPASPVSPLSPQAGEGGPPPVLPPRYQVLRFLGRGGMGRVYLCRDGKLEVDVAIKVLPAELSGDMEALEQIEREARAAAKFRECPGILSLYGFEQHRDAWYLVMEYAAGGSLHDRLKKEGRLPEAECRRIGAEVAEALAFAHEQKILHRDVKPANVLLDAKGRAKVADFGIARALAAASSRISLMTVAGTPVYMAPEILLQEKVDGRADLYSLGCMLYEMATGERPFSGAPAEVAFMKAAPGAKTPDPRDLRPDLTEGFGALVRRLLSRNPADRFPDASSCAAALHGAVAREGHPSTIEIPAGPSPETWTNKVPLLVGVAALALSGIVLMLWIREKGPRTPPSGEGSSAAAPNPGAGEGPGVVPEERGPQTVAATTLVVFTEPPGAQVSVDGVERGIAAARGLVVPGLDPGASHMVSARLDSYEPAESRGVVVAPGGRQEVRLALVRSSGYLRIEGGPPGASVRVEAAEGPPRSFTLAEDGSLGPVALETGTVRVTLSRAGFEDWTNSADIERQGTTRVVVAPRESGGTLTMETEPEGAEVYEEGVLLGRTPLRGRPLAPGKHALRVVHPEAEDLEREVQVKGGEAVDLGKLRLRPLAILDVTGLPEGVTAVVEGLKVTGRTRRAAGEVVIEFSKPGYASQTLRVALRPGEIAKPLPGVWSPPASTGIAVAGLPPPPRQDLEAIVLPKGFAILDGRILCERDGAEMVLVPAGEFPMGSKEGDEDERPVHGVFVSAFLVDRHEVTVGQFRKFCEATGTAMPPEQARDDRHPVVGVTWDEAVAFARWAGKRLPTEAEWEKAARGTDGRPLPWGSEPLSPSRLNCGGAGKEGTTPVGSYPTGASPYGCLDMAGNVLEWCSDWFGQDYYAKSPPRDPQGPPDGKGRLIRGGSWRDHPLAARSTYRFGADPSTRMPSLGFRTARGLP